MSHIETAKAELMDIDARIQALIKRRDALRSFVDLGSLLFSDGTVIAVRDQPPLPERVRGTEAIKELVARRPRETTIKARIEQIATNLIERRGNVQTAEILSQAEGEGVKIGAADKLLAVSTILSRSPSFTNNRSLGWSLTNKKPESVATFSGFHAVNTA